jgi:hypothetical protein
VLILRAIGSDLFLGLKGHDDKLAVRCCVQHAAKLVILDSKIVDVLHEAFHHNFVRRLLALRRSVMAKNPAALSRVHVPKGISFEQLGGTFIEHDAAFELAPGVWLLGAGAAGPLGTGIESPPLAP